MILTGNVSIIFFVNNAYNTIVKEKLHEIPYKKT